MLIAAMILSSVFAMPVEAGSITVATETNFTLIASPFYRTELYFGRSIPGGGRVSDDEWEKFLADVVTPRFPDGFTIIKATGQYREKDGTIDKEQSEVLVFFYPVRTKTASRRKIEEIRRAYVKQFKQESVLRLDFPSTVDVKF